VLDDAAFGAATEVTPKFISPTDPATRQLVGVFLASTKRLRSANTTLIS
jgi:hypothetical protein